MSKCPFLSSEHNKVACFKECLLHQYENENGKCPFEVLVESMELNKNVFGRYKNFEYNNCNILEEIYKENNFLKIFQI